MDANFILLPITKNIDIYEDIDFILEEPCELVVFSPVIDELKNKINLYRNKTKLVRDVKLALALLQEKRIKIIPELKPAGMYVDDYLVEKAIEFSNKSKKILVATNDKELRNKLRKHSIRSIYLRSGKKLEIG